MTAEIALFGRDGKGRGQRLGEQLASDRVTVRPQSRSRLLRND